MKVSWLKCIREYFGEQQGFAWWPPEPAFAEIGWGLDLLLAPTSTSSPSHFYCKFTASNASKGAHIAYCSMEEKLKRK